MGKPKTPPKVLAHVDAPIPYRLTDKAKAALAALDADILDRSRRAERARALDQHELGASPAETRTRLERLDLEREALDSADAAEARARAAQAPAARRAALSDVRRLAPPAGRCGA